MKRIYLMVVLIIISIMVNGCKSTRVSDNQSKSPPKKAAKSVAKKERQNKVKFSKVELTEKLQMPDTVKRLNTAYKTGDTVSDFKLKDIEGDEISLYKLLKEKPVMLEFGSYTCPVFRQSVPRTETIYKKYKDKINFLLVYVIEAHPAASKSPYRGDEWTMMYSEDKKGNPVKQPQTYEERNNLALKCIKDAKLTIPVVVDKMDNTVWEKFGPAPNLAYFIGMDKKVVTAHEWYNVSKLETTIKNYIK